MKVEVKKVGGTWHGTVEGTQIGERGLTAEIAERKAREALENCSPLPSGAISCATAFAAVEK
jgi:hypothetical protein